MDEIIKMTPDEICRAYLREIARTLGQERADASHAYYSRGWYYINISSRFPDGSVGTGGREPSCMRKSELLKRIETLGTRPDYGKEANDG